MHEDLLDVDPKFSNAYPNYHFDDVHTIAIEISAVCPQAQEKVKLYENVN